MPCFEHSSPALRVGSTSDKILGPRIVATRPVVDVADPIERVLHCLVSEIALWQLRPGGRAVLEGSRQDLVARCRDRRGRPNQRLANETSPLANYGGFPAGRRNEQVRNRYLLLVCQIGLVRPTLPVPLHSRQCGSIRSSRFLPGGCRALRLSRVL